MLKNEVNKNHEIKGFIFDGFPRTISQAETFDSFLESINMSITATIFLDAKDSVLEDRLIKRGQLSGRTDDQDIDKIRNRFKEYNIKTFPLIKYYNSIGKLHSINGIGTIDEIRVRLSNLMNQIQ